MLLRLWIGLYSDGVTEIEKKAAALLTITGFAFEYITTAIQLKQYETITKCILKNNTKP
jgi:hypothetical protein